jgi:hypothetical protein
MNKVIVKVSDIKKQNTTRIKIQETLSQYNLSKIDEVVFYIKDMFYPPKEKEQWKRVLENLQRLVFNETYYKELVYGDTPIVYIPEVKIKFGKQLKELYNEW